MMNPTDAADGAPSPFLEGPLLLRRIDPTRNMARWYTLAVEMTLFDEVACTRAHGRIGARGGRLMIGLFASRAEAETELRTILRRKQRRGYELAGPPDGAA